MARTEKLRRKDILEPDEFITLSRQAITFAQENRTALLTGAGLLALVLVAVVAYQVISASRHERAGQAYHAAHRLLADRKYPEAATAFQEVVATYGSTTYAALSELQAGNALLAAGRASDAAAAYQGFLDGRPPTDSLRQAAQVGLAYAQEQEGRLADARGSFAAAVAGTGPFGEDALLGQARMAEAVGDQAAAKALYEQLLDNYPESDRREFARDRLARLGWSPPAQEQPEAAGAPHQVEAAEQ